MSELYLLVDLGFTLGDVLSVLPERPDSDCAKAYEVFDNEMEGDLIDRLNQTALESHSTKEVFTKMDVYGILKRHNLTDRHGELWALATEHAVRKARQ